MLNIRYKVFLELNPICTVNKPHLLSQKVVHVLGSLQAVLMRQQQQQLHYKIYLSQLQEMVLNQ